MKAITVNWSISSWLFHLSADCCFVQLTSDSWQLTADSWQQSTYFQGWATANDSYQLMWRRIRSWNPLLPLHSPPYLLPLPLLGCQGNSFPPSYLPAKVHQEEEEVEGGAEGREEGRRRRWRRNDKERGAGRGGAGRRGKYESRMSTSVRLSTVAQLNIMFVLDS